MASQNQKPSRREILKKTGASLAAVAAAPLVHGFESSSPKPQGGANDKIVLGLIGCGGMGAANMRNLMGHADCEVAAICDVDLARVPNDFNDVQKKYGRKPEVYTDYRKMLERKDIDAVIVGTPDHWHALNLIHTCEAGKDSYCEKPISHNLLEAVYMANAAKRFKRVVQVGTWQRSDPEFRNPIAHVRSGKFGRVVLCRAWISDGTRIGKGTVSNPPEKLDYDMWIGPAKMVPYKPNMVHWNWRWVMNTGGGLTTDWGVHMMDIALLGMSKDQDLVMPTEVSAIGGQWAISGDDRDAPDTTEAILRFREPDFAMHWSVNRDHPGKPGHCTEFVNEQGHTLRCWRGGYQLLDADGKEMPKPEGEKRLDHWRDFLDCVKSRKQPIADISSVAQTTIVCHLVNAALYSGQMVKFDKKAMDIVGRAGKDTLSYSRPYRKPWTLPRY